MVPDDARPATARGKELKGVDTGELTFYSICWWFIELQ
jgi:hypothetical protein